MIELVNCSKSYGDKLVLDNISLKINKGDFIAFVGDSGCGKTTLMNLLGTIDKPSEGMVLIDNIDINKLKNKSLSRFRNNNIGFVFQSYYLLPDLTVYENLRIPLIYSATPFMKHNEVIENILHDFGLISLKNQYSINLSGGEQQRVAIARAMINNPNIIIADEPTGNLDENNAFNVITKLKEINAKGVTIIIVTHNKQIGNYCNIVYTIKNRKIDICD
jgi:ABC-type lipoprotein export system ATPase subunit